MKETQFIKQNHKKWEQYEKKLSASSSNPDEIRELYTELNNDLSFAQTFYEKRTVRAYLNYLAQSVHRKLYKQKKEPFSALWKAWTVDIPLEIFRARKNILFALVLFLIYATIGAFSTHQDINFAKSILGSGYINLTEQNIADGNPLGIYGSSTQGSMFVTITLNNIKVALMCFFGGILFSLGTHVILFNNAVMVGVFQYFFKLKGLLLTSFLTIWIHGAFEISAIVIASGAGFTLGHGILFPGSYTRLQSLQMSGMRGIRIMLSLVPIFIIAGFLESYVTRNYQVLPDWSKWLIVLFSFSIVLFYYLIFPVLVARKYPEKLNAKPSTNAFKLVVFNPNEIRKKGTIIRDSFQLYRVLFYRFWKNIAKTALPLVFAIIVFQNYVHFDDLKVFYQFDWASQLSILFGNPYGQNFNGITDVFVAFFWLFPLSFIALSVFHPLSSIQESFNEYIKTRFMKMTVAMLPIYFLVLVLPFYLLFAMIFIFPFFVLVPASVGLHKKASLKVGFHFATSQWNSSFVVLLVLCLCTFFFAQPFGFVLSYHTFNGEPAMSDLLDWFTQFLQPIIAEYSNSSAVFINIIRQLVYVFFIVLLLPLFFISFGLIFYSGREEESAVGLYDAFKKFGKRSRTQETKADFNE